MKEEGLYQLVNPVKGIELKERKSKFLGYAFPTKNEEEIAQYLAVLREEHPQANHHCYAWRLGAEKEIYRVNDDGEPRNSAGLPIYRKLQGAQITQCLVVVVRYFGGTKLGVGGLIQAYGECAALTLESGSFFPYVIQETWEVSFAYEQQARIDRLIELLSAKKTKSTYTETCTYQVVLDAEKSDRWLEELKRFPPLPTKQLS